jgi:hypothetical protein
MLLLQAGICASVFLSAAHKISRLLFLSSSHSITLVQGRTQILSLPPTNTEADKNTSDWLIKLVGVVAVFIFCEASLLSLKSTSLSVHTLDCDF